MMRYEDQIVPKGVTELFSLFAFQDDPTQLPVFLHLASKVKSDVHFENEDVWFYHRLKDDETQNFLITVWHTYLTMNSKHGRQYINYQVAKAFPTQR